jgi:hypothetical protein
MSVLHDHAVLGTEEIRAALPNNDLFRQIERVRFTLQPLSVEEIFRLWSGFQTQYRLSVAYEVAVVLIESARSGRSPLPVLTRGQKDSGIRAQPELLPPFASVDEVVLPNQQSTAQLGDTLTINGHHLSGGQVRVIFQNPALPQPIPLNPVAGATSEQIKVTLDDVPAKWVAGVFGITVEVTENSGTASANVRSSNVAALALAPKITTAFPINVKIAKGNARIVLNVSPEVRPDQRVILLLGEQQIAAEVHAQQTNRLTFVVTGAQAGEFLIRVRVDGVDSIVVDRSVKPPMFKPQNVVMA